MRALRTVIVLAFGLALQIGRYAVLDALYPKGPPEWAAWTSVVAFFVLWFTLGNLLHWQLGRWWLGKSKKIPPKP